MYRLLISPATYGKSAPEAEALLRRHFEIVHNPYNRTLTTEEFTDLAQDCDAVIAGTERITGQAMEALPRLKVISRYGAGVDNVDIDEAKRLGIKVFNTPDAPARAVAELTVCLILSAARLVPIMHSEMKSGVWNKRTGFLLEGKNVGIVGFGRIGQMVAELLLPFGVHMRYHDIESKDGDYGYEPSLDTLLRWSDIVTLHCAASGDGRPVLGRMELGMLRKGAVIVNTARGALIDEDALYDALRANLDMVAALDVYGDEPYYGPLRELPNVIMTPHVASAARETRAAMDIEAADNCIRGRGIHIESL